MGFENLLLGFSIAITPFNLFVALAMSVTALPVLAYEMYAPLRFSEGTIFRHGPTAISVAKGYASRIRRCPAGPASWLCQRSR